jgi:hypothetical protein
VQFNLQGALAVRLVIIESPFAGNVERNKAYAQAALLDSLRRGEAPFASHLLYTQVLDDTNVVERAQGILAGLAWGAQAALTAVYMDRGVSPGMTRGIEAALAAGRPVEYRRLPAWQEP